MQRLGVSALALLVSAAAVNLSPAASSSGAVTPIAGTPASADSSPAPGPLNQQAAPGAASDPDPGQAHGVPEPGPRGTANLSGADPPISRRDPPLTHTPLPFWASSGSLSLGMQVAYGIEVPIARDWSHVNVVYAQPQLAIVLHKFRRTRFERIELVNEGMVGSAVHPGGRVLGYAPLLRLEGRSRGNTKLLLDWGAGINDTNLGDHAREISGRLQFTPQAGIGLEHFFSPQRALVFEYRYVHMSNAGIVQPNFGFQCSVLSVGFRWLRRPRD